MIAFIEKHNRLPSQEDSIRLGFRFASSGGADPAAGMLSFLRRFVNFYEKHGRMPQGNELDESNP